MLKKPWTRPASGRRVARALTQNAGSGYVMQMNRSTAVPLLSALAEETRLGVFRLLAEEGREGLPVFDIARRLRLTNTTLSFHLKELSNAGLINARKDGRFVYYSPDIRTMNNLLDYLRPGP